MGAETPEVTVPRVAAFVAVTRSGASQVLLPCRCHDLRSPGYRLVVLRPRGTSAEVICPATRAVRRLPDPVLPLGSRGRAAHPGGQRGVFQPTAQREPEAGCEEDSEWGLPPPPVCPLRTPRNREDGDDHRGRVTGDAGGRAAGWAWLCGVCAVGSPGPVCTVVRRGWQCRSLR